MGGGLILSLLQKDILYSQLYQYGVDTTLEYSNFIIGGRINLIIATERYSLFSAIPVWSKNNTLKSKIYASSLRLENSIHCCYVIRMTTKLRVRVIPLGTVDNNLGPDRLTGLKALYPNYNRQPTLWLHYLCLEVLTVHGIPPYSYYLCRSSDMAAVGTTFNVFSYDAVWAENWTHHLPNACRMRYLLPHRRGFKNWE